MLLLSSADFFSKLPCSKNSFEDTIRVSNSLDPDQDRHLVGPDLGPNYLLQCTTRPHSAVGNVSGYICESNCRCRGHKLDPGSVPYFCGD